MKPVVGAAGYFVTVDGEILSTHASSRAIVRPDGFRTMRGGLGKNGYLTVRLRVGAGAYRTAYVHHLVADAFLGDRPEWHQEIRHLDGDKLNNRASNLAWGTRLDNQGDPDAVAKRRLGSRSNLAKLSEPDVVEIRRGVESRAPKRALAARFGVSTATINHIIAGRAWRHVQKESA